MYLRHLHTRANSTMTCLLTAGDLPMPFSLERCATDQVSPSLS